MPCNTPWRLTGLITMRLITTLRLQAPITMVALPCPITCPITMVQELEAELEAMRGKLEESETLRERLEQELALKVEEAKGMTELNARQAHPESCASPCSLPLPLPHLGNPHRRRCWMSSQGQQEN